MVLFHLIFCCFIIQAIKFFLHGVDVTLKKMDFCSQKKSQFPLPVQDLTVDLKLFCLKWIDLIISVEYIDIGISSWSVPSSGSVVQHIVLVLFLLWQPSFLALMTKRVPILAHTQEFCLCEILPFGPNLAFSTFWPTNFDDTLFPHRTLSSFLIFFLLNLKYKPSFYAHLDYYSQKQTSFCR